MNFLNINPLKFGRKTLFAIIVIELIITAFLTIQVISTTPNRSILSGSTYTIGTDGTDYWALRYDGLAQFQGQDAATVISDSLVRIAALGGGTVGLQAGTYDIKRQIELPFVENGITLTGQGATNTILKEDDSYDGALFDYSNASRGYFYAFMHLYFYGGTDKYPRHATGSAIITNGNLKDGLIFDCFFDWFKSTEVSLGTGWNWRVESSAFENSGGNGLSILSVSDAQVIDSKFLYDQTGLFVASDYSYLTNDFFYQNLRYGAYVTGNDVLITSSTFLDDSRGKVNVYPSLFISGTRAKVVDSHFDGQSSDKWNIQFASSGTDALVEGNGFSGAVTAPVSDAGNGNTYSHDSNLNPFGLVSHPFDYQNDVIRCMGGAAAAPSALTNYTVTNAPIYVTSTGGAGVSISIFDGHGNVVLFGLSILTAYRIPLGWMISFGTFSAVPVVTIWGE